MLALGGTPVPLASLAETVGLRASGASSSGKTPVVVLAAGDKRMAFVVDEFQAEQEVVVKGLGARVFAKSGAEGIACAALPEVGLGLAVKADDGAGRAAQVMIAALIQRFGRFDDDVAARFMRFVSPRLLNWNGAEVGLLRPVGPLA